MRYTLPVSPTFSLQDLDQACSISFAHVYLQQPHYPTPVAWYARASKCLWDCSLTKPNTEFAKWWQELPQTQGKGGSHLSQRCAAPAQAVAREKWTNVSGPWDVRTCVVLNSGESNCLSITCGCHKKSRRQNFKVPQGENYAAVRLEDPFWGKCRNRVSRYNIYKEITYPDLPKTLKTKAVSRTTFVCQTPSPLSPSPRVRHFCPQAPQALVWSSTRSLQSKLDLVVEPYSGSGKKCWMIKQKNLTNQHWT